MIHYGDITKISGYDVPVTDVVTFGAPCQDLSVAGKRKGMQHTNMGDEETTRSGLFHEAIRIIKEMRDKDERICGRSNHLLRPRFAVYENVPGAFSSNKGQDFRIVLEELAKIVQKDAVIPMPPKDKWTTSGCIMGDGWSIAWRVLDAQFWGVPQRRRRIALVADFGGGCAQEVLFVKDRLRGDTSESRTERKGASEDAQGCIGVHDRDGEKRERNCLTPWDVQSRQIYTPDGPWFTLYAGEGGGRGYIAIPNKTDDSYTLRANAGDNQMSVAYSIENHPNDSRVNIDESGKVQTLTGRMGTGGGNVPMVMVEGFDSYNLCGTGDKGRTICTPTGELNEHIPCVVIDRPAVVYRKPHYIVRRLTPLECERLQGFPDYYTDIGEYIDSKGKKKKTSDSARYKALGNSIALPPWKWVLKRISAQYERDATLASLFDGIGGFPLLWEQINGKGSCLWASEIEDFPMAVTTARIE